MAKKKDEWIEIEDGMFIPTPGVIAICGSLKYWEVMLKWYETLSLDGFIVLLPVKTGPNLNPNMSDDERTKKLVALHLHKIDMADQVFVVNPDGYIGEHTEIDINYAKSKGKPIEYLNPPPEPKKRMGIIDSLREVFGDIIEKIRELTWVDDESEECPSSDKDDQND